MVDSSPVLQNIADHPLITKMIEDLTFNQFYHKKLGVPAIPINRDDIRKAVWLMSILATSNIDEHRNKAQVLSSLLYLQNPEDESIGRAAYVLFSRLGNLTGAGLLKHHNNNYAGLTIGQEMIIDSYDPSLMLELQLEKVNKTIFSGTDQITTTCFQKNLWEHLTENNKVIISAPTSSGKSFIIKKFLKAQIADVDSYTAVYIVPSRALINQVSEDLRNEVDLQYVSIKTVFIADESEENKREIFILTPERCLRLLKERWLKEFNIDFIFIDEIQNVEDIQGRGSLFEFVYKELFNLFPLAKIVAAGPNIENPDSLYDNVFGKGGETVETTVSPVFQIKATVKPLPNNQLKISVNTQHNIYQSFNLSTDIDYVQKFKNIGEGLKHLIHLFGKGEQNIIYSPKGNLATLWALKFAETQESSNEIDPMLAEIIEFLQDEIHPLYEMIPCLSKRTAYHHGYLPEIVRKEIEDCFLEGKIRNLFCTTTLLQGVNLPANNLFIPAPQKRNIDLTPFDFGNLIGRAGRIKDSLYGTIFCIERSDEEWSNELYSKPAKKVVRTAGEISLETLGNFIIEVGRKVEDITQKQDRTAIVFFIQKFAQNPEDLRGYLLRNDVPAKEIETIEALLQSAINDLVIPTELLRLNPTIDPLLQNILYKEIESQGIENWLIPSRVDNKNSNRFMEAEEKADLKFSKWNFYSQLNDIIERLDKIFMMTKESYYKYGVSISVNQMCYNARDWLRNKSMKQLIDSDIAFYSKHYIQEKRINPNNPSDVNYRINRVIKVNSVVITHILIKYMKLLNDLAEPFMSEEQKEKYKFALALPTMLELGTSEPIVISLISRGVSRSIALKIFAEFKKAPEYEEAEIFSWLASKDELKLKPIYNRYLKRMRLLKNN
jgi:hypothetical protein